MRDAVEAWQKENLERRGIQPKLRGSAVHCTEEFKECVAL
jgi:hypothetical protein